VGILVTDQRDMFGGAGKDSLFAIAIIIEGVAGLFRDCD
jgi:hypothetical protein